MTLPQITAEQIELFILIFLRVSAIIVTIPIVGNRAVPLRVKGGLAVVIAFLVFPFVTQTSVVFDILPLSLKMAGEVCIGIVIGLLGRFVFAGIQLAGQLIGFQMGFAIVNVVDPVSSSQVSIISQLQYLLAILIFLAVDGHHIFLFAIVESFNTIPPLGFHFTGPLMEAIIELSKDVFMIAVKAGAPIIAILLFTSVSLGMVARTVPQINIFIVGFPLKIAVGLIGIGLTFPFFARMLGAIFANMDGRLKVLMDLM